MGLFSDYFDQLREDAPLDPTLGIPPVRLSEETLSGFKVHWKIYETSKKCEKRNPRKNRKTKNNQKPMIASDNEDERNRQNLIEEAENLEWMIDASVYHDKILRCILNNAGLESPVSRQKIEVLIGEIDDYKEEMNRLLLQLRNKLGTAPKNDKRIDEDKEKRFIKDVILFSLSQYVREGHPEDSTQFRIIVSDFAKIKRLWEEDSGKDSRTIFRDYLTARYNIKPAQNKYCWYCNALMYIDVPFCLNCYEKEKR